MGRAKAARNAGRPTSGSERSALPPSPRRSLKRAQGAAIHASLSEEVIAAPVTEPILLPSREERSLLVPLAETLCVKIPRLDSAADDARAR